MHEDEYTYRNRTGNSYKCKCKNQDSVINSPLYSVVTKNRSEMLYNIDMQEHMSVTTYKTC